MIFSPARSITRQLFGKEAYGWVHTLPVDQVEWDSSSRTYESNRPSNIACLSASCCGTWVAAIRSNATIPIWQTGSGEMIRVLDACLLMGRENYNEERKNLPEVCFSPWNRKELVSSVPKDPRVIIWDVTTGKILQQLSNRESFGKIHLSYLTSARDQLGWLSQDSRGNRMVSIWNTKTGQMLKSARLPESSGRYILSPTHGIEFAWAEEDPVKYVKIFNMDTHSTIHILKGTLGNWKFSPDGLLLAISIENRKVTILPDTTSSKVKQTFEVATDIEDFALSPDGKLLAIATLGGIEIFSLTSGKYLRKIMTKSMRLIFSSDGSKIFSAFGPVIHVAEIARESLLSPGWSDISRDNPILIGGQVSISPNCKLIASVFKEPRLTLRVMDINSKKFTHVLGNSHLDKARNPRILFSPDSKKLALVSEAMVILWNISSPFNKVTIAQKKTSWFGYEDMEEDFAFSSDSARFATTLHKADLLSTHDFTIKVWDTSSGMCLLHLGQRRNGVRHGWTRLSFSPDGERLAISWLNEKFNDDAIRVEIWEIASKSAVQAIDLNYYCFNNHVRISSPNPVFSRSSGEEYQQVNEARMGHFRASWRRAAAATRLSFLGEGHLMLDLRFDMWNSLEPHARHVITNLRLTLRARTDLDLTGQVSSAVPFREANIYDTDTDRTWIEFYGRRLVWIPPQYRYVAQHSLRNCVAFSRDNGSSLIIQFRHDNLATQTYLRELPDNWDFVFHDMNLPDDKLLENMDSVDRIKEPLLIVGRRAIRDFIHSTIGGWVEDAFGRDLL